jgi:hypothetical protein
MDRLGLLCGDKDHCLEHFHFENALTADSASIGSAHEE